MVITHFRNRKKLQKPKLKKYESVEFADKYDNDHDVEYYLDRLDSHFKRFLPVFDVEEFERHNIELNTKDKRKLDLYKQAG